MVRVFCFLKLEPSSFVCAWYEGENPPICFILPLCYTTQNVMKGIDMSLLSLEKYSIFKVFSFDMKLHIAKSCWSSFKAFTCAGKFRLGRPQEVIYCHLLHKARSGQNLCKTCLMCDLGKANRQKQTKNPAFLMFGTTFWKYFPLSSSPLLSPQLQVIGAYKTPNSGVLQSVSGRFLCCCFPSCV